MEEKRTGDFFLSLSLSLSLSLLFQSNNSKTTTKEKIYQLSHVVHQYTTSYYSNKREERLGAREGLREGEREKG